MVTQSAEACTYRARAGLGAQSCVYSRMALWLVLRAVWPGMIELARQVQRRVQYLLKGISNGTVHVPQQHHPTNKDADGIVLQCQFHSW